MHDRDYKDLASGLILVLLGAGASAYAAEHYSLGSFRQPGPGAFPTVLGVLLVIFGVLIGVPAFARKGTLPQFEFVPFASVVCGVIAFGMMIEPFGLIPSIIALVAITTIPEKRLTARGRVLLAIGLSLGCTLIFVYGLGLTIDLAKWPF